jgi:hypothetical protein
LREPSRFPIDGRSSKPAQSGIGLPLLLKSFECIVEELGEPLVCLAVDITSEKTPAFQPGQGQMD